jgi:hypothetical protein
VERDFVLEDLMSYEDVGVIRWVSSSRSILISFNFGNSKGKIENNFFPELAMFRSRTTSNIENGKYAE